MTRRTSIVPPEDLPHGRRQITWSTTQIPDSHTVVSNMDDGPRRLQITIESTFATVRHRSKITKGPGSRAAGLAMAFKLIESAQTRWRAVNAPHLVALVRAGARFLNGKLVERPDDRAPPSAA